MFSMLFKVSVMTICMGLAMAQYPYPGQTNHNSYRPSSNAQRPGYSTSASPSGNPNSRIFGLLGGNRGGGLFSGLLGGGNRGGGLFGGLLGGGNSLSNAPVSAPGGFGGYPGGGYPGGYPGGYGGYPGGYGGYPGYGGVGGYYG